MEDGITRLNCSEFTQTCQRTLSKVYPFELGNFLIFDVKLSLETFNCVNHILNSTVHQHSLYD